MARQEYNELYESIAHGLLQYLLNSIKLARIKDRKKAIEYIIQALQDYTRRIT